METDNKPYQPTFFTGDTVKVIDEAHPMKGWVGIVTSPNMWSKPRYRPIPFDHYRIEMESGDGRFYGDYSTAQLELVRAGAHHRD